MKSMTNANIRKGSWRLNIVGLCEIMSKKKIMSFIFWLALVIYFLLFLFWSKFNVVESFHFTISCNNHFQSCDKTNWKIKQHYCWARNKQIGFFFCPNQRCATVGTTGLPTTFHPGDADHSTCCLFKLFKEYKCLWRITSITMWLGYGLWWWFTSQQLTCDTRSNPIFKFLVVSR